MCGIAAIIDIQHYPVPESLIQKMTRLVAHRGPDDEGYYFDDNLALGHRRLSIIDLSNSGHQPMVYKNNVIVYNGEIYNYREVREELVKQGYSFASQSDTEVILAAYDFWGMDCVQRFNGMWAFVLYDKNKKILFCSRDRFGIKPFCYSRAGKYFMLASEAKQFTANNEFKPTLNPTATSHFIFFNLLNFNEETLFEEVKHLPGGHNLIYDLQSNSYSINKWYHLDKVKQLNKFNDKEAAKKFNELFFDSIRLQLRSDVIVGSCLSGGLDSSSIVTMVKSQWPEKRPFYTISTCYPGTAYDEQQYIDAVVRKTGFQSIKIFPDLQEVQNEGLIEKLIWHQDQPLPSMSHYSEYKVFEGAHQNKLKVMLDGQGSDEYMAGYGEFFAYYQSQLFRKANYLKWINEIRNKAKLGGQVFLRQLRSSILFIFKMSRKQQLNDNELGYLLDSRLLNKTSRQYSKVCQPDARSVFQLSLKQILHTSIPYQLHSEDRNSMMHSVESRVPFLDHRLVEFGLSLPDDMKIRNGITKYILRQALQKELPATVFSRHSKLGFPAPETEWMITHKDWFYNQLLEAVKEYPSVFGSSIAERFSKDIGTNVILSPYFRSLSLYKWLKVFNVTVNN